MRISQMAKKEMAKRIAKEYAKASKKRKGELLDAICEMTGWSRDNARRQIRHQIRPRKVKGKQSRKRRTKYSDRAHQVLANVWALSGQCCGLYLHAQIREGVLERLMNHKELRDGEKNLGRLVATYDPVLEELWSMSSATMDRYLKQKRKDLDPLAKSTTKPASYTLRNEIPFGKSYDTRTEPGWLSTDTVAHCGESLRGDHIWTINSTDTLTGWTETLSIKGRASCFVREGHEELLPRFPFPILGINYDSGSEFINREMIDYAHFQDYQMTRSRPYHSNDNAHVEQKNGDIVRRYAFRYRYNGETAMEVLNELWYWVNLRKNYLVPTRKCIGHTKTRSGRTKGIYDSPKSPARRVLEYECVAAEVKEDIRHMLQELNDALVTRKILALQEKLLQFAFNSTMMDYVNHEVQQVISA